MTCSPVPKHSELPATRRSLKTQQHAAASADWELAPKQRAFPGSVDISSPDALPAPVNSRFNLSAGLARHYCLTGSGCPQ